MILSWRLYIELVKLHGAEGLDWDDAALAANGFFRPGPS